MAFLAAKPELDTGSVELARAYAKLSTNRQVGMGGIGPIPSWVVDDWLDRKRIHDPRVRDHVEAILSSIDAATLRRANKSSAAKPRENLDPPDKHTRRRSKP